MFGFAGIKHRFGVIPKNALAFIRDRKKRGSEFFAIPDTARAPFRDDVGFHPSPQPSPYGRGNRLRPWQQRLLSQWERDRVRGVALLSAICAFILALFFAPAAFGEDAGLLPHPPKGKGEHCVRDTDFMRRYHMTMLKHQRDETVHEGVRGNPFSIAACVNCHAVKGADGQPVSYDSPKHFCRSCHDYVAVSIDCFECHASKPGPGTQSHAALTPPPAERSIALANYLQEGRQ